MFQANKLDLEEHELTDLKRDIFVNEFGDEMELLKATTSDGQVALSLQEFGTPPDWYVFTVLESWFIAEALGSSK